MESDEICRLKVDSAFGFGALYRLAEIVMAHGKAPKGIVLDMSAILVLDSAGVRALGYFQSRCRRGKVGLLLTEVHAQPLAVLRRTELMSCIATTTRPGRS